MKEVSNDKEVNEISKKELCKALKQKKQVGESDKLVKSNQKIRSNRSNDEKKYKFCGRIHKENALYMGRNVVNARKKSLGKLLLHQEGS